MAVSPRYLVTNCHVLEHRPAIVILDGDNIHRGSMLRADSDTDRCIVATESGNFRPVRGIRSYTDLSVGERVFSIGAPAGLDKTLGEGLISGLRDFGNVRLIQTSAPISPGSSGGGLFDSRGNLIGITTMMLKEAQNLNFAIAAGAFWAEF